MAVATTISLQTIADLTKAFDLVTGSVPLNKRNLFEWASGTGADQANRIFHDQRTLAASANEDLDLSGGLSDAFGDTIIFARVLALLVAAASANANNVLVGGAAANQFINWVANSSDIITVRPGGLLLVVARDATAYAVTAGTGDLLRIANSAGGTSVTYDIVIIGST